MIELKNISKSYNGRFIFENINLKVNDGDLLAIMGDSGKGKTTLLNIMGGLEKPSCGNIIINGVKNPDKLEMNQLQRKSLGYIFQNYALIESKTVEDNLKIALTYAKNINKLNKINEVLSVLDMYGINKKYIYELSGGEQQRVALARVMIKECNIIFADEPTGNLDIRNRDITMGILKKLNSEGKTIIIVTHDSIISEQCDRIIQL